jgi:hypothetical protein
MVATFAVLGVALDSQTDIVDTGREVADTGLKKQQENFVVTTAIQTPGKSLEIHAKNNGQNPTEIFTVIMTNSSDSANGFPTTTFEIPSDNSFLPPGDEDPTDIVENLDIKMKPAVTGVDTYQFKVISSLGNIEKLNLVCDTSGLCGESLGGGGGDPGLDMQLFLDGPNGVNTKTSTIIMFVSNSGDVPLKNVYPVSDCESMLISIVHDPPSPPAPPGLGDFAPCSMEPLPDLDCGEGTGICLAAGQSVIFRIDGTVAGDIGDEFLFCNSVAGQELDGDDVPPPSDCDKLNVIDPNDCGGCGAGGETIILIDDLLIRPSIFMVIPSPFGLADDGDDEQGIWGINVANPTNKDMEISKVTIVAYPPGGASQDNVFSGVNSDPCFEEDIQPKMGPGPEGYWDCPRDNILVWDGLGDPLTLAANSTKSFMVKVKPDGVKPGGSAANLDALIVQANVWSTFGSFGKSGYQSTMYLADTSIVNVYLSNSTTSRDSIIGYQNDIPENSTQTYNVVFADMDDNPDTVVEIGARLIVNLPREWEFVGFNEDPIPGFEDDPDVTVHSDGSTQIIATTDVELGTAINPAIGISFDAKAPDVDNPRLYVMYVLADGIVVVDGVDKTIGPLNEVVLNANTFSLDVAKQETPKIKNLPKIDYLEHKFSESSKVVKITAM